MTTSPREGVPGPGVPDASTARPDRSSRRLLVLLGAASFGAAMALLTPAVLTLSLKATTIDAPRATSVLSVAVAVGSVVALVAAPAAGRWSDRTAGRLGRRRPYLVLAAALFVVGAVVLVAAGDTAVLTAGTVLTMVGSSVALTMCTAVIADRLPPEGRGPASAVVGLSLPVGAVIGLFVAQLVAPVLAAMILLPALLGCAGALALAFGAPDRPVPPAVRPARRVGVRALAATFWVDPRRHPDFAWAWTSRLLLFLGVASVQAYQAFFLVQVLGFAPEDVAGAVFGSTLVLTVTSLLAAPLAARASDRVGRRKPFVAGAAAVFAVGLALASAAGSFAAFLVAMAVMGLGQGVYFAVDIALITLVLPDPANPAKDLGLANLANSLPQSLVPAVAPLLLAIGAVPGGAQNFTALFLFGAVAAMVGALLVVPIRGAR